MLFQPACLLARLFLFLRRERYLADVAGRHIVAPEVSLIVPAHREALSGELDFGSIGGDAQVAEIVRVREDGARSGCLTPNEERPLARPRGEIALRRP